MSSLHPKKSTFLTLSRELRHQILYLTFAEEIDNEVGHGYNNGITILNGWLIKTWVLDLKYILLAACKKVS
jgi:hypothetical protein